MEKISIRNSKNAKSGLQEMINYVKANADISLNHIVEIGSYVGDSSKIFAENFNIVTCVDPWVNGYDDSDAASYQHPMSIIEKQFDEMAKDYPNIVKIKNYSIKASKNFEPSSLDIIYIDGIHNFQGVTNDINIWLPKIKKGGFITGHDYQKRFQGVIDAVNHLLGKPDATFPDSSWVKKIG